MRVEINIFRIDFSALIKNNETFSYDRNCFRLAFNALQKPTIMILCHKLLNLYDDACLDDPTYVVVVCRDFILRNTAQN